MENFKQKLISGKEVISSLDYYIELWWESDSELSKHEYLGFSSQEWNNYIKLGNKYLIELTK